MHEYFKTHYNYTKGTIGKVQIKKANPRYGGSGKITYIPRAKKLNFKEQFEKLGKAK